MLYNRTEHSQGFSICFIIKNPLNSPSITFNFQNKLYFQSEQQCRQHALYSHILSHFFEWTTAEFTGTWRSLWMTAPQNSAAVKGHQSKLLFLHSKGGRCSFWGLLYCDNRRSPWWASRDGLRHDHIRSDTVMISMNFNNYASLVIFFIISVLFCFVFEHWTLYTIRVLAVFDFYYRT